MANQTILQDTKKIPLRIFWCKNLLNFTWFTMKFQNCHHTNGHHIYLHISVSNGTFLENLPHFKIHFHGYKKCFLTTLDSIALQHLCSLIVIMQLFIFHRICFIIIPPNFHWWKNDLILTSCVVCYLIVGLLGFSTRQKQIWSCRSPKSFGCQTTIPS